MSEFWQMAVATFVLGLDVASIYLCVQTIRGNRERKL